MDVPHQWRWWANSKNHIELGWLVGEIKLFYRLISGRVNLHSGELASDLTP